MFEALKSKSSTNLNVFVKRVDNNILVYEYIRVFFPR